MSGLLPARYIREMTDKNLKDEAERRFHCWLWMKSDGGRRLSTYLYRLTVNELQKRGMEVPK